MEEINTPDISGTDEPQAETDFDAALDGMFDDPQEDNVDPQEGDQEVDANASDEEAQSDENDGQELEQEAGDADPVKYVLPDGTEVTADQVIGWQKDGLRQSDYTRKTQELAAQRREVEQFQQEYQQQVQRVEQELDLAIKVAEAYMPPEPDERLLHTGNPQDAVEYNRQQAIYGRRASELQGLVQAQQAHQAEAKQRELLEQQHTIVREQEALYEALPELRDEKARLAFKASTNDTIKHYGFTEQELDGVFDHRLMVMLKDLNEFHKLKASKPAVQRKAENAPPVRKPGNRASANQQRQRSVADRIEKLRQTGSIEDFEALL